MGYTLGQAEKATGKAKTTIQRAIEKGKISALRNDNGHYDIDPSDLHRIYPLVTAKRNSDTITRNATQPTQQSDVTPIENKMLQTHIDLLQEQLEDKNKTINDLRHQRDDLSQKLDVVHETLSQQTRLLEHHQDKTSPEATEKPIEGQESYLASQSHKNASKLSYDRLKLFMAVVIGILLVLVTKDYWLPITQSWIK